MSGGADLKKSVNSSSPLTLKTLRNARRIMKKFLRPISYTPDVLMLMQYRLWVKIFDNAFETRPRDNNGDIDYPNRHFH